MPKKTHSIIEHWDFQTPEYFAWEVVLLIKKLFGDDFSTIIEPTCWVGSFLSESWKIFKKSTLLWFEIHPEYVASAKTKLEKFDTPSIIEEQDFFWKDWKELVDSTDGKILFIWNPPWVTSSQLWIIDWGNLPWKSNFKGFSWFEALTGKSNFDISEWMLIHLANILIWKKAVIAFLCKTSVARKFLQYLWKNNGNICASTIYRIDAKKVFWVSVDACLLVCDFGTPEKKKDWSCKVYRSLNESEWIGEVIGYIDGRLVSHSDDYTKLRHFMVSSDTSEKKVQWRSGIKHDCSKVMELEYLWDNRYRNWLWEEFPLEETYVYPLMKSSDVANGWSPRKYVIATQKKVKDDTQEIKNIAPLTWHYLSEHEEYFTKRWSSIYKNTVKFSIFWVWNYTYLPYKIAVSWLYTNIQFQLISDFNNKTIVFDDTVNFLSFSDIHIAKEYFAIIQWAEYQNLLQSLIFLDNKRPVTIEILNSIDLEKFR
jgi:hypothetical protein